MMRHAVCPCLAKSLRQAVLPAGAARCDYDGAHGGQKADAPHDLGKLNNFEAVLQFMARERNA